MPPRVLIADDNRDAADTLGLLFDLMGVAVRVAYRGDDALRLFDGFRPHVGVFDIDMPGLTGLELARVVRRRQTTPLLLIALTGGGSAEAVRETAEAGFDLHVTKPGLPVQLVGRATAFYRTHCLTEG